MAEIPLILQWEQHIIWGRWLIMNRPRKRRMASVKRTQAARIDFEDMALFEASAFDFRMDSPPQAPEKVDFDSMRADIRRRYAKTLARLAE